MTWTGRYKSGQSYQDRSTFIEITLFESPILSHYPPLFEKTKKFDYPIDKFTPYDVHSIMHYDGTLRGHFSNPVLIDRQTKRGIEVNKQLSVLDIKKLNEMYPCNPTAPACGKLKK